MSLALPCSVTRLADFGAEGTQIERLYAEARNPKCPHVCVSKLICEVKGKSYKGKRCNPVRSLCGCIRASASPELSQKRKRVAILARFW